MLKRLTAVVLCMLVLLAGCGDHDGNKGGRGAEHGTPEDLGDDDKSFGSPLEDMDVYDGYFEEAVADVEVVCVSGTADAFVLDGNKLTFTAINEDSVYAISGKLNGSIVVDVGDEYKLELEMGTFSLVSEDVNPITVLSGDEVSLKAKKDTANYIYDMRSAIDKNDELLFSGAIHSKVDLEICGKGSLKVVSENNNGIHSKDDLKVKNLTLTVVCIDNALKGNDSVTLESGETTLIASRGDGIKTVNTDVSTKGNQRGSVNVLGGKHTVYAACDGIDSAYSTVINGEDTVLTVYTDKYSTYSGEVTDTASSEYYIRFTNNSYYYSVKYYNSDEDFVWYNAQYHSVAQGNRTNYYYYSFPKRTDYDKIKLYIYALASEQGQEDEYLVTSDYLEPNTSYDTFAITSRGSQLSYSWTNYTTKVQEGGFGGHGGMNDGNSDKSDHSAKGIKAGNEVVINNGTVNIKSYDDAIHANADTVLENGASPLGNVTVNAGNITLYSNDDGIHADGTVGISGGTVSVVYSYEGVEGSAIRVTGGYLSVTARDDGVNSTATSGTGVEISGGSVYVYCNGDGIDSNSRTSYSGIVFSGGKTVIISNSGGNSAIDTEQGYKYTGGAVVAVMPRGGMSNEAIHCQSFSSKGCTKQLSLTKDGYLKVGIGGDSVVIRMPVAISAYVVVLGSSSASIAFANESDAELDVNGVCWK